MADIPQAGAAVAERFADWATGLDGTAVPDDLRTVMESLLLDVVGLCVAARHSDYVAATMASCIAEGPCTAIGHARGLDAYGAALVNGTAIHGEDYDDTFEGTPVHAGAAIVPAVLAAGQARAIDGERLLAGMAVGSELACRLALVAPTAMHRAGFHPTAIIGALGATAGVCTALGLDSARFAAALGIAGSFASGIIEYLSEGAWTKRVHPGWAAQAGIRAALMAEAGFLGPRTVIEGPHGFFFAFAEPSIARDFDKLTVDLGTHWHAQSMAFKVFACGTMCQPFIDCALRLRREGVTPERIRAIHCTVGEGTVHRLWEPMSEKIAPSTSYAAKFSVPYCIAVAFADGAAGLEQFSDRRTTDAAIRDLAARVGYEIDPDDEYPRNYTGYLRVTLDVGSVVEARQPHLRGGRHEPLGREDIVAKMRANLAYGGWSPERTAAVEAFAAGLFGSAGIAGLASLGE
ncbi:MAG: MmgE/PrpD family protein [Alphaproteobacteria bacterium]